MNTETDVKYYCIERMEKRKRSVNVWEGAEGGKKLNLHLSWKKKNNYFKLKNKAIVILASSLKI